jgi:hypothetical protein
MALNLTESQHAKICDEIRSWRPTTVIVCSERSELVVKSNMLRKQITMLLDAAVADTMRLNNGSVAAPLATSGLNIFLIDHP